MAYATPADLDSLVQSAVPAATATLLLALASSAVDDEVGRPLASQEYTETIDATGTASLWLDWPLTAVASVTYDGDLLVLDDDYTWTRTGRLRRTHGRRWTEELDVVYTAGFAANAPEMSTAKRITLEIAARVAANPQALKSFSADGAAATFGDHGLALSDEQRDDLATLRSRRRLA